MPGVRRAEPACLRLLRAMRGPAVGPATDAPAARTLADRFEEFEHDLPEDVREHIHTHLEGENRVVTVLFADMTGSVETTRHLSGEDTAGLVNRLLRRMVDILLTYDGRIDNFLGDGVLAVFGTPQAHENDPERAIRAAIDMRQAARELGLETTSGVDTGEVYFGHMGSELHRRTTVMGSAVNLAARFQAAAKPGEVLVGSATYERARRAFDFTARSLRVKGMDAAVVVYSADRLRARPEKVRGIDGAASELIGRVDELAKLNAAVGRVVAGRGQIVSVIGEAGVGKSRLVRELHATVSACPPDGEPPLWLEGDCQELGSRSPYGPFVDILRQYLGWTDADHNAERADAIRTTLRSLVAGSALSPERATDIGACIGRLLDVRFHDEWDDLLNAARPEHVRRRTFDALRDMVVALSETQPLVLVLEDLHWADRHSLDLLSEMMDTLHASPIMLVCVYRPDREHASWRIATRASRKCPAEYTEIDLRELTPEECGRLMDSLVSAEEMPPHTRTLIAERSNGNPFFVEEIVRAILQAGAVYGDGGAWEANETVAAAGVPESITGVVLNRVDGLDEELKDVVRAACVVGTAFPLRVVEEILEGDSHVETSLEELEDIGIVYRSRGIPEPEYSFRHTLTRDALYQTLLTTHRARVHREIGEAIETLYAEALDDHVEEIAHHFAESDDDRAGPYLVRAGDHARAEHLNHEAEAYYTMALDRLDDERHTELRIEALSGLARTLFGVGRVMEAEVAIRQAVGLARGEGLGPEDMARLLFWLAEVLQWQSRYREVAEVARDGLELLRDHPDSLGAALMNHHASGAAHNMGDFAEARRFALRNASFIRDLPYTEELGPAFSRIAVTLLADSDTREATRWMKIARDVAVEHHDLRLLAEISLHTGAAVGARGSLRRAGRHFDRANELCATTGDEKLHGWAAGARGWLRLSLGDVEGAIDAMQESVGLIERVGHSRDLAIGLELLGASLLANDAPAAAAAAFARAVQCYGEAGTATADRAHLGLAYAHLARGAPGDAREWFHKAARVANDAVALAAALNGAAALDGEEPTEFGTTLVSARPELSHARWGRLMPELADPERFPDLVFADDFRADALGDAWEWEDPLGDCGYEIGDGLRMTAPNGRGMSWESLPIVRWRNMSAPRLSRPAPDAFAVQIECPPAQSGRPEIGGLLLWQDRDTYIRLDRGTLGPTAIACLGAHDGSEEWYGRAYRATGATCLRLERVRGHVRALCRAPGAGWMEVANTEWRVQGEVRVGLCALGSVDRIVYHGAFPDGAEATFHDFRMWV